MRGEWSAVYWADLRVSLKVVLKEKVMAVASADEMAVVSVGVKEMK